MVKFKLTVNAKAVPGRAGERETGQESAPSAPAPKQGGDRFASDEDDVPDSIGKARLPREFQNPEEFRRETESRGAPAPRLIVPAALAYPILISAMAWWCYYGNQYNNAHFPVSLTALITFFGVFLALFATTMVFRAFHRRVKLYPVLERMAGLRPGAFLLVEGVLPTLLYAKDTWIGKVSFCEGGEDQSASTRLDARIQHPQARLEIHKKGILGRIFRSADRHVVLLPDGDFSRKFVVMSTEPTSSRGFLDAPVMDAVMRLAKLGNPIVRINRTLVTVEIENDLSRRGKEEALEQFLADAETIVGVVAQESSRTDADADRVFSAAAGDTHRGMRKRARS